MWKLTGISLAAHDLEFSKYFYGQILGLGKPKEESSANCTFYSSHSAIRLTKFENKLMKNKDGIISSAIERYVIVEIADLGKAETLLERAGATFQKVSDFRGKLFSFFVLLPCKNILMVCEADGQIVEEDFEQVTVENWKLHHVNLQSADVRKSAEFLIETLGLEEGSWRAPEKKGDFSIEPSDLSVFPIGAFNGGLHIIKPDPGFALRNNFAHNPSIGGHPAIAVEDIEAVKRRLEEEDILVTDAGTYAMAFMHQIYCLDPSGNVIEINQYKPQ